MHRSVELGSLSLSSRYGAAVNVVDTTPSLTLPQRAELLWLAVFPPAGVMVPGETRRRSTERPCPRSGARGVASLAGCERGGGGGTIRRCQNDRANLVPRS
jgi:hypothetical protein